MKRLAEEKASEQFDNDVFCWLLQQLQLTNKAITPVLHATRLRTIKPEFMHLYESAAAADY